MKQGMPFRWSKQKSVCGISVVKRENRRSKNCGDFQFWWTVRGSNPRPRRCERRALPAELTAQISHFSIKKVAKNGFLRYSILRGKSGKPDEKLEGKNGPVMEVHMDANRNALPAELRARGTALQQRIILYHNFHRCKDYFFRNPQNFLLPIRPSYSKINKL